MLDLPRYQCVSVFNLMSMVAAELIVINFSVVIGLWHHVFPILSTMVLYLPRCLFLGLFNLMSMGVTELIVIFSSAEIVLRWHMFHVL
jgi:hypothetical protein